MVPIKSIAGKDTGGIVSATIASKQVPKTLELGIDVVAHGRKKNEQNNWTTSYRTQIEEGTCYATPRGSKL